MEILDFCGNFRLWGKFRIFVEISDFCGNFGFSWKFQIMGEISDLGEILDFGFSGKFWIFVGILDFRGNFGFLGNFRLLFLFLDDTVGGGGGVLDFCGGVSTIFPENASLLKRILRLVPNQEQINFLYNTCLLFPRIRDPRATFKAVLMAVDMT